MSIAWSHDVDDILGTHSHQHNANFSSTKVVQRVTRSRASHEDDPEHVDWFRTDALLL